MGKLTKNLVKMGGCLVLLFGLSACMTPADLWSSKDNNPNSFDAQKWRDSLSQMDKESYLELQKMPNKTAIITEGPDAEILVFDENGNFAGRTEVYLDRRR